MYKKTKEYWAKKAAEDYDYALQERKQEEQIQKDLFDYNKRNRESGWLLQGVQTASDDNLKQKLASAENTKVTRNYAKISIVMKDKPVGGSEKTERKQRSWLQLWTSRNNKVQSSSNDSVSTDSKREEDKRKHAEDEFRLHSATAKKNVNEMETLKAQELYQKEEMKKRADFIQRNFERLVVLKRVKEWLRKPRLPAHHHDIEKLPGFIEEKHIPKLSGKKKKNL
jgi:hypothetical protein